MYLTLTRVKRICETCSALLFCVETHEGRESFLYDSTCRREMGESWKRHDDDDEAKIIKEIKFEDLLFATATLDMNFLLSCVEFVFQSRAARMLKIAKN